MVKILLCWDSTFNLVAVMGILGQYVLYGCGHWNMEYLLQITSLSSFLFGLVVVVTLVVCTVLEVEGLIA